MSFYVTLPSNSSMDLYENNTLSNFTTKLKIPLKFNVPYEVALVEMTYNESWTSYLGYFRFIDKGKTMIGHNIYHIDGTSILSTLNNLSNYFNRKIDIQDEKPQIIIENDKITFKCNTNEFFEFHGPIKKLLNLPDIIDSSFKTDFLHNFKSSYYIINTLYVYTDIIKYQYVGDTLAPLLRNVQVSNNHLSITTITYDSPHFNPLNSTYIDTINISIKDDLGEKIHFFHGHKTKVKLHFRPVKYGF